MGVTHLQSFSARLEVERTQESVGGEWGAHFGVRKMVFQSKYSFPLESCTSQFHLDVVLPPCRLSYFFKGDKPNIV